jgi:hypothetical protein
MKTSRSFLTAAWAIALTCCAGAEPAAPTPEAASATAGPAERDSGSRADRRYDEMLGKMQAAVEEIAQLYGNPVFLQVFTNDVERAEELKRTLRSAQSGAAAQKGAADLVRKREDLLNDIALKERESARLASRLVRQRAALDALAMAVEQARKAVEETAK